MAEDEETTQYRIIQDLYAELENEREASATATAEALSMISRLQGEKAAQKMEACQYKRLVEEKTRHTEELLVIFDELLHQKEVEIKSLKFHVQDYLNKLSDFLSSTSTSQVKVSENQLLNGSNSFMHDIEAEHNGLVRRNRSLPIMEIEELTSEVDSMDDIRGKLKQVITRERSGWTNGKPSIETHDSLHRSYSCCSQQEEIKEKTVDSLSMVSDGETSMVRCTSGRNNPDVDLPTVNDQNTKRLTEDVGLFCRDKQSSRSPDWDALFRNNTPSSMHDIYEVPQDHNTLGKVYKLNSLKASMEDVRNAELIDSIAKEATDCAYIYEKLNKGSEYTCHECELHASTKKSIPSIPNHGWSEITASAAPPLLDGKQLEMRLHKLEDTIVTQNKNREEQTILLREIQEKLNIVLSTTAQGNPEEEPSR